MSKLANYSNVQSKVKSNYTNIRSQEITRPTVINNKIQLQQAIPVPKKSGIQEEEKKNIK
jgi:hypothetical protein